MMPVSAVARATAHCWLLAAVGPTCSGGVSMVSMVYRRKHRMDWRGVALARAGMLHTIMFNRALGMVQPRERESECGLDVYWVECNDPQVRVPSLLPLRAATSNPARAHLAVLGVFRNSVCSRRWRRQCADVSRSLWGRWRRPSLPRPTCRCAHRCC
jgi:hypothetical protein